MAPDTLRFDPGVVPQLRKVFTDALTRLDRQIDLAATELRVPAWAGDPISEDAVARFNNRSLDDESNALDAIKAYRVTLAGVVDKLNKASNDYHAADEDAQVSVSQQGEG